MTLAGHVKLRSSFKSNLGVFVEWSGAVLKMTWDGSIVQRLRDLQTRFGYIPKNELRLLVENEPGFTLHRLHDVASSFPHFRLEPPNGLEVRVCRDMACHLAGAAKLREDLEAAARSGGDGPFEVRGASCLGLCDKAPAMIIGDEVHGKLNTSIARSIIEHSITSSKDQADHADFPSPAHAVQEPTGWRIDPYGGEEKYSAVRSMVAHSDPAAFLNELDVADLRGMGGAGVKASQKWKDVRDARGDVKYVVCNADESEPSTFKDRELLLRTPHLVLEGVILGGLLIGAKRGYIFIRHEYHPQIVAMRAAIERAERLRVCGPNILGSGRSFPVEVFVSPGGYICGEQSALIEAIEGKRAEPRNKPPQIETNGLDGKPTLLSNVETFAWVPSIANRGGAWYRDLGLPGYKGARFFSICGDLNRPGVYEVPNGTPLRVLVNDLAGGISGGQEFKAFAPSGPSGGFLPAKIPVESFSAKVRSKLPEGATHLDLLDLELDLDRYRQFGLMLGAGMMIYGDRAKMLDQAVNAVEFYRNESCGKCVPCRIGTQKLVELSQGLANRTRKLADVEPVVRELKNVLEMSSICGLGMVASSPIASVLDFFRGDLPN